MSKWAFRLEELGKEHNHLVGRKCANLGEMLRLGLRVPPGFALSTDAYQDFLNLTGAAAEIKEVVRSAGSQSAALGQAGELSARIRQIVLAKPMPEEMAETVLGYYAELCRKCRDDSLAVSVRSAGPQSRPGQYETYLNVAGPPEVLENIKKVWASTFNPRSLAFRQQKSLPLDFDPIGAAVLKMVPARSAGVAFTADPNTGDTSRITIEANWGVGESVVSGTAAPDIFIIDKKSLELQQKSLGAKTRCVVVTAGGVLECETPVEKRAVFCLRDEEVKEIARMARQLEEHFGVPQDVEWAIDPGAAPEQGLFLLQARAEVIAQNKTAVDRIVDLMLNRFSGGH